DADVDRVAAGQGDSADQGEPKPPRSERWRAERNRLTRPAKKEQCCRDSRLQKPVSGLFLLLGIHWLPRGKLAPHVPLARPPLPGVRRAPLRAPRWPPRRFRFRRWARSSQRRCAW